FAPARTNLSTIAALALLHASQRGVTPKSFLEFTFAPARMRRSALSRSFQCAAQVSAVAPSACGIFTSMCCLRRERTTSLFCLSTASTSRRSLLPAATVVANTNGAIQHMGDLLLISITGVSYEILLELECGTSENQQAAIRIKQTVRLAKSRSRKT